MTAVEEALYQTKNRSLQDPLNFPMRLNDKLNAVAALGSLGDYRPDRPGGPGQERAVGGDRRRSSPSCAEIWDKDLARFQRSWRAQGGVAAVIVPPPRLK